MCCCFHLLMHRFLTSTSVLTETLLLLAVPSLVLTVVTCATSVSTTGRFFFLSSHQHCRALQNTSGHFCTHDVAFSVLSSLKNKRSSRRSLWSRPNKRRKKLRSLLRRPTRSLLRRPERSNRPVIDNCHSIVYYVCLKFKKSFEYKIK